MTLLKSYLTTVLVLGVLSPLPGEDAPPDALRPWFEPPPAFRGNLSNQKSPLQRPDGKKVTSPEEWRQRRAEILQNWHTMMGPWPPVLDRPRQTILTTERRENFTQHRIRLEIAPDQFGEGYLLIPDGKPPFPAVYVPFYNPETSIGLSDKPMRDFALQLTRRGFVSLSMGAPGGDARKPELVDETRCQPLSYLGYLSANAWQALAATPEVDSTRIGIVGHSYGGKWALFGSCLWEKYACAVWSDPGVVFDEARPSVNYWEPWYLGLEAGKNRKSGLITSESPRTGAYKALVAQGYDLTDLHALMAPRPFLVSGGSEDFPARWTALNHAREVNEVLGVKHRVAMHNRELHEPNEASNAVIYRFMEWALRPRTAGDGKKTAP